MVRHTSTEWASWYVIPADHKPVMRALVSHIVTRKLNDLNLEFPVLNAEEMADLDEARTVLENE